MAKAENVGAADESISIAAATPPDYEGEALAAELRIAGVKPSLFALILATVRASYPGESARVRVQACKKALPDAFDSSVALFPEGAADRRTACRDAIQSLLDVNPSPAVRTPLPVLIDARGLLGPLMPAYFTNDASQGYLRIGMVSQPIPRTMLALLVSLLSES